MLSRCSGAHMIEFLNLEALIGRLRASYEENGGQPESNPFGPRAMRIYLREKKRKRAGGSASGSISNTSVDGGGGGGGEDDGTSGNISSNEVRGGGEHVW
ncbi:hypothetical protein L1987_59705 [Smallanthus sonchifolius]|uniref:Uncharacterized protein n=1 Tax=Smallanthus sonchifolius TaxID=185202 RepID=A0ACB9D6D2_9ASTR|nr:hypothetical protein L1987_59705 [Smallanthus sonchifolius]